MRSLNKYVLSFLVLTTFICGIDAAASDIVISQIYGGGGNSGAALKNDYIELFNRGNTTVILSGWTVQYASASGTAWDSTPLTGSIAPGHYYLVQEGQGSGGTQNLPTPDASGAIAMSATAGKVALVSGFAVLSGSCPSSSVVDIVGYGSANCSEGPTAPTLTNTTAAFRAGSGSTDSGNNAADFSTGNPNPRNSSSLANICGGPPASTNPSALISASPSSVQAGSTLLLVATVTPGTNPASSGIRLNGNLSAIGGSSSQQFYDDGTNGDATPGDNSFSFQATVSRSTSAGSKALDFSVNDAQSRTGAASISITVSVPAAADTTQAIFPHVADGGGYKTVLLLTNGTVTNTTATISFFTDTGSPLTLNIGASTGSSFSIPIPARGSSKLTTSGTPAAPVTGWAQVTTSPAMGMNGNAIFQFFKGSSLFSEASVPAALPSNAIEFYADEEDGFNTGVALANPGTVTAVGTLTLYGPTGNVSGTYPISIPPAHHLATFLWQIFTGASSGRAELNLSSGALSGAALRYHTSTVFSTVSVGLPGGSASPINALFSPNGGVRARIISEISRATGTIDIAIYSFTADEIRDALVAAKNRGVTVRIVADTSQASGQGSEVATLEGLGFNLKRMSGVSAV